MPTLKNLFSAIVKFQKPKNIGGIGGGCGGGFDRGVVGMAVVVVVGVIVLLLVVVTVVVVRFPTVQISKIYRLCLFSN